MRIFQILLEYNRDITKQKIGDKLSVAGQSDRNVDVDTILQTLEEIDPTPNKQYVLWLANQYMNSLFRLEDKNRVKDVLSKFMQVKSRLPEKDIGRYTFHSLEDKMDELFNVELKPQPSTQKPNEITQQTFEVPKTGVKVLYNGPLGLLAIPLNYKTSCILGRGTKWCTAATDDPDTFNQYKKYGPLYIWRDKNGQKYQFHFNWAESEFQFMDARDRFIKTPMMKYLRNEHPIIKKMFELEEQKFLKTLAKSKYKTSTKINKLADSINFEYATERMPYFEKVLIDTLKKAGNSYNSRDAIGYFADSIAPFYAKQFKLGLWPEFFEQLLRIDTNIALDWFLNNSPKGTRSIELEKALINKKEWSTIWENYVPHVGYLPEEMHNIINKNLYQATEYAILKKKQWPELEKELLASSYYTAASHYAKLVLKKRWPELEKKLLKPINFKWAIRYAEYVIKKRWPELEDLIKKEKSAYKRRKIWKIYVDAMTRLNQKFDKK
jgi:hypothetical protein